MRARPRSRHDGLFVVDLDQFQAPGCAALDGDPGLAYAEVFGNQSHQLFVGFAVYRRGGDSGEPCAVAQLFELAGSRIGLHFDSDDFHRAKRDVQRVSMTWVASSVGTTSATR
jgi:hypothetical protein